MLNRNLRVMVVVVACVVSCGSSKSPVRTDGGTAGSADARPDAAADARRDAAADAAAMASGSHYYYVAKQINVPTSNAEALAWGLDLTGSGTVNNQLGMVLGTLSSLGFDIQGNTNAAVAEGHVDLLLDLQTDSFTSTSGAGIAAYQGSSSTPPACNGSSDTYTCTGSGAAETCSGCAHQFGGSAMFTINSNAMTNAPLVGPITAGAMAGGPGNLTVPLVMFGTQPVQVNLIGAKVKATDLSATALGTTTGVQPNQTSSGGVIIGGGVSTAEIDSTFIPGMTAGLNGLVAAQCCGGTSTPACTGTDAPPGCGCASGSTGQTILGLFLPSNATSCTVTALDVQNNSLIQSLLAPDVTIDGMPALSFGFNVTAVGAVFTP